MIIYDDTRIDSKPSSPLAGFEAIQLINLNSALWDRKILRSALEQYDAGVPIILGLENSTKDVAFQFVGLVRSVLQEANLNRPVTIYGQMPRKYWEIVRYREAPQNPLNGKARNAWLLSVLANEDLYRQQDFLCPSVYTFPPNTIALPAHIERWKIYAEEIIGVAKTFDKPVYPYLMPYFHLTKTLLPVELLTAELELIRKMKVDAMIWFVGESAGFDWNTTPGIQDFHSISLGYV